MSRSYPQCNVELRALIVVVTAAVAAGAITASYAAPPDGSVRERLAQTMVSIDLDGIMFSKVIDQLRADHHLNIYVNERALAVAGVGRDTRITVRLENVPLAAALELILRDAGGGETPLTYVVENDVVVVSTGKETSERPVTRVYDVTDLIDSGYAGRRFLNTPLLSLKLTGEEGRSSESDDEGSASQNPFQGGAATGRTFERLETLLELIKDTIHPEAWRDNGGTSTINRQGSRLIVSAGLRVHQEIEALITLLRGDSVRTVDLQWTLFQYPGDRFSRLREKVGADWPRMSADAAMVIDREAAGDDAVLMAATTTGPSGRGQFVSSLRQQDYITTYVPVVDESAVAYQPRIAQANTGVELIVLPIVAHDGRALTLDVSLALAAPDEIKEQRYITTTATRDPEKPILDVAVQLRKAELRTVLSRLRLELGQAVILSIPDAPESRQPPQEHTLLLLRPTVH